MGRNGKSKKEQKEKGTNGTWCYTGEKGWHLIKAKDWKTIVTVDNSVHGGAA